MPAFRMNEWKGSLRKLAGTSTEHCPVDSPKQAVHTHKLSPPKDKNPGQCSRANKKDAKQMKDNV